jgi:type II protein arginine methyltransferase
MNSYEYTLTWKYFFTFIFRYECEYIIMIIFYRETVPIYHFKMLLDHERNQAYYNTLKKVITSDSIVLDIGSGSGLLSMMASRLGAKSITGVERHPLLCKASREIIKNNNFTNIDIIEDESFFMSVGDKVYTL